jgi:hypothetical protein
MEHHRRRQFWRARDEAKAALREIYQAPNLAECNCQRAEYCTKPRATRPLTSG